MSSNDGGGRIELEIDAGVSHPTTILYEASVFQRRIRSFFHRRASERVRPFSSSISLLSVRKLGNLYPPKFIAALSNCDICTSLKLKARPFVRSSVRPREGGGRGQVRDWKRGNVASQRASGVRRPRRGFTCVFVKLFHFPGIEHVSRGRESERGGKKTRRPGKFALLLYGYKNFRCIRFAPGST